MCVRACLVCAADREDGVTLFSVKLMKEKCCDCVRTKKPSVLFRLLCEFGVSGLCVCSQLYVVGAVRTLWYAMPSHVIYNINSIKQEVSHFLLV